MKLIACLPFFLFCINIFTPTLAQKTESSLFGSANGIVFDSIHNHALQSATLAIYKVKDTSLVSYQLSNKFGEFHFKNLPVGIRLTIVANFVGYKSYTKKFTIVFKDQNLDLKTLFLEWGENILQEVIVKSIPPVTMNGDTLEFNTDALKLDKNAVIEDLMRKLPGITIWGDGTITVNGRKVSKVLVDGKPFFGGDIVVAIQNIPKDAVDKIQVYQQDKNRANSLDSITEVNIKLKKDKKFGHFGKFALGYGNGNHFETDANLNLFSPKTQMGIVGAANNINKIATDINTLMRNSTYKGVGASIEYQPDFNMRGINQPNSGGFTYEHDFNPTFNYNNSNRLTANYFINNNNNKTSQITQTTISLGGDSTQMQLNNSLNQSSNTSQDFTSRYENQKDKNAYFVSANLNTGNISNHNLQHNSSSSEKGLQSTNNADIDNHTDSKKISLEAEFTRTKANKDYKKLGRLPDDRFTINYSFDAGSNNNNQLNKTEFISIQDPTQNKLFDRRKDYNSNDTKQHLYFKPVRFYPWIFSKPGRSDFTMELKNNLYLNTHNENNNVKDKDTTKEIYIFNQYLSNNSKYTSINEMPSLNLGKVFHKDLPNQPHKTIAIDFTAQAQFFNQKNISNHLIQNFTSNYQKFMPLASILYLVDKDGDFRNIYRLSFSSGSDYPTVQQLVPLVDSSNLYYIQQGNARLKPTDKKELNLIVNHNSYRAKNTFSYDYFVRAGITDNSFADSSITDNLGRSTHYIVNADGKKYLSISGDVKKAFKFTNHQLQVSLYPSIIFSRTPNNINGVWYNSNNVSSNNSITIYYTYKDWLAINFKQGYSYYHSKQSNISSEFSNNSISSALSGSLSCTKKLTLNSNVTYNRVISSGSNVINFTIWNANLNYRFFKANNAEIKFSALDLLHQNTSIINTGSNNMFTHGIVNVMQQYFMVTFTYFPRKFGKK